MRVPEILRTLLRTSGDLDWARERVVESVVMGVEYKWVFIRNH